MEKTYWRIWSNEHNAWWKPAWRGYTPDKSSAGKYPYKEAVGIVRNANKHLSQDDAVPNEAMILIDKE
jgi:hypothetical protein